MTTYYANTDIQHLTKYRQLIPAKSLEKFRAQHEMLKTEERLEELAQALKPDPILDCLTGKPKLKFNPELGF